jgi:hypothetical protein
MSTFWPWVGVLLGAVLVAVGALLGQGAWNKLTEVEQRQQIVRTLADACASNRERLTNPSGEPTAFQPVETELLAAALTSGLFVDKQHDELRARVRSTHSALVEYNYSLSNTYAKTFFVHEPRDLPGFAERGLAEVEGLATLLGKYGAP